MTVASRARVLQPADEGEEVAPLHEITEAEWSRILDGRLFRPLVKAEQVEWAGKNARSCMSCGNCKGITGDPRRGYCITHSCMRGAIPVLCREFVPA